jgi:hypothetical protein
MRTLLALPLLLVLAPSFTSAETPAAGSDTLSEDEGLTMCAEALPKQLECKNEFCAAMVKIRTKGNPKADLKAMEAKCIQEIAVDGTGDLATRKARCAGWARNRPKMSLKRTEANEMSACWTRSTCAERVDCWSPKMSKMMEAAAPKKK